MWQENHSTSKTLGNFCLGSIWHHFDHLCQFWPCDTCCNSVSVGNPVHSNTEGFELKTGKFLTCSRNGDTLSFCPDASYHRSSSFTVVLRDHQGGIASRVPTTARGHLTNKSLAQLHLKNSFEVFFFFFFFFLHRSQLLLLYFDAIKWCLFLYTSDCGKFSSKEVVHWINVAQDRGKEKTYCCNELLWRTSVVEKLPWLAFRTVVRFWGPSSAHCCSPTAFW